MISKARNCGIREGRGEGGRGKETLPVGSGGAGNVPTVSSSSVGNGES